MNTKKKIKEDIRKLEEKLKALKSDLASVEANTSKKNSDRYERKKLILASTGDWLYANRVLKEGDIIKITGSRAGRYRRVVSLRFYQVIGAVAHPHRARLPNGTFISEWSASSTITTQGMNKVTHIFRDGKFIKIVDLMKECQNQS